jgi:hypothetical protein
MSRHIFHHGFRSSAEDICGHHGCHGPAIAGADEKPSASVNLRRCVTAICGCCARNNYCSISRRSFDFRPLKAHILTFAYFKILQSYYASRFAVCYLRNLFPSDLFKETSFGGTTIRALCGRELGPDGKPSGPVRDPTVATLLACQEAAFEALDKGYLRCVAVLFMLLLHVSDVQGRCRNRSAGAATAAAV